MARKPRVRDFAKEYARRLELAKERVASGKIAAEHEKSSARGHLKQKVLELPEGIFTQMRKAGLTTRDIESASATYGKGLKNVWRNSTKKAIRESESKEIDADNIGTIFHASMEKRVTWSASVT